MIVSNDEQLLSDLQKGGRAAYSALKIIYQTNYPKVSHMIFQKGGQEADAKDVFQESMIVLHKMIREDRFRQEASVDTVIYAIARNIWYQKLRKTRFTEDFSNVRETNTGLSEEMELNWEDRSLEKTMGQLVAELSEDCQKIIRLFYYERLSMEKIKTFFGLKSLQAAKNKKYRCMKDLIEIFRQRGIKPDSF